MSDIQRENKKDVQNKNGTNLSLLNSFKGLLLNDYHTFLIRKVEKLASAIYVITGFLPSDEPVRNRLRVCSLDLIERASRPTLLSEDGLGAFISRTSEIGAILQTARSAGLISPMNAEMLSEEYAHLADFVKKNTHEIRDPSDGKGQEEALNVEAISESYKGHIQPKQSVSKKSIKSFKSKSIDKGQNDRKKLLLDLLDKKDRISIKDAVSVIKSCSEKTIQRELLSLVEEGLVIKEGERRWSTYSKAPQLQPLAV